LDVRPFSLVIRGDARAIPLRDESVDGILTDEPYGMSDGHTHYRVEGDEGENVCFGEWDRELDRSWVPESVRILKPGGTWICFTDRVEITSLRDACIAAGLQPRNTIYWVKHNSGKHGRRNFRSNVEVALYCVKPGAWYWANMQPCNFFLEVVGPRPMGVRYHPNQKTMTLARWLVRNTIRPGSIICDPMCGSGTFGLGAVQEGSSAICIDRDVEAVSDRLAGRPPKYQPKKAPKGQASLPGLEG